ncbi:MAG: M56 family metallopeptidase [Saprospiraceae bacterium]|nr:M56 family metallopeptidase [Saprospiraceae bacterium]
MINSILSNDLAYALAWTLIHSIWQFTLVALMLVFILKIMQNKKSTFRYFVGFGALGICMLISLVTFSIYYIDSEAKGVAEAVIYQAHVTPMLQSSVAGFISFMDTYLFAIVNAWLIGSLLFLLKFTSGYVYLKRIIKDASASNKVLNKSLDKFRSKFDINRKIEIKESNKISTPLVMGYIKPIILFPLGLVNQLTIEEVNAIIAHEVAHIKRHDYLFNILQIATETIFYYHPAIWYISSRIRLERENCCDDLAIQHTGNSVSYAKTLIKLQEIKIHNIQPALGFSGNKNAFKNRILRLINQPHTKSNYRDKVLAALLLFTTIFVGAENYHVTEEVPNENYEIYIIDDCPQSPEDIKYYLDTIPERNSFHIKKKTNNKELELEMENGEITKLKIDGSDIPKEELSEHEDVIVELMPDDSKDIITLFPECGDDFGNVYLLEKLSRNAINMDSIIEKYSQKNSNLPESHKKDFYAYAFEDFDDFAIDTIRDSIKYHVLERKLRDNNKNIFIDSIWDLFPQKMPKSLFETTREYEEFLSGKKGKINEDLIAELKIEKELNNLFPKKMEEHFFHRNNNFLEREMQDVEREFFNNKNFNKNHKKLFDHNRKVSDIIIEELLEDGLIPETGKTKVEITGKYLKIDGDKQPKNLWNKYKTIYEKQTGISLTKSSKIFFEISSQDKEKIESNSLFGI